MLPDGTVPDLRVADLNALSHGLAPETMLRQALADPGIGRVALVSSFGAESVVLLHLASRLDPDLPVIFLDTQMLFPETYAYQRDLALRLGLRDLRLIRPDPGEVAAEDGDGRLHADDADACCALRKTRPLDRALEGFDAWITGRKRFHGAERAGLDHFEREPSGRLKLNPLAHVGRAGIDAYMAAHDLPRHPLVAQGFASIGCAPCTTRTRPDEAPRAGRWRGTEKTECGVHFLGRAAIPADTGTEAAA